MIALASQRKLRHTVQVIRLDQVNGDLGRIRAGEVVARAVIKKH